MTDPDKVAAKLKKKGYAALSSAELHIAAWQLTPGGCHACTPEERTEESRNEAAQRALNS